ncbi:carbohydrate-binding module family [Fusarium longipes]|uniref:Carbohydrate-binding module family n=1 Tax=Fusarium longipes TaxID=694270 RepID=A0A395T8X8_9HYPO|nr:carbohydrate-binding module family [Fusarium longipes]
MFSKAELIRPRLPIFVTIRPKPPVRIELLGGVRQSSFECLMLRAPAVQMIELQKRLSLELYDESRICEHGAIQVMRLLEDSPKSSQLLAMEVLRPRYLRIVPSRSIWNPVAQPNWESFSGVLNQDKAELFIPHRFLGKRSGPRDPADAKPQLENTSASDQDSKDGNLDDEEIAENMLSNLEGTNEFFVSGKPFHVYRNSLYQLMKPTPMIASTPKGITSGSDRTLALEDRSAELDVVADNHRPGQQSGVDRKTLKQKSDEAFTKTKEQTKDTANDMKHGIETTEVKFQHQKHIDDIERRTPEPRGKQIPQCSDGLASPISQNLKQTSASFTRRRVNTRMTKIYGSILTFLSSVGLREDDITPGHHRIRWKNNRGKLLYDDYIEHESGALKGLEDYLNSVAYSPTMSSTSGSGSNPTTSVSGGSSNHGWPQASASGSGDIADQNSRSTVDTGTSPFQKDLEKGNLSTSTLHVLSCMNSRKHTVILREELVTHITDDRQLFRTLQERYFEHVGKLKRHWSLRTLNAIHFMKFAYGGHRYIDVRCHSEICEPGKPCVCLPPAHLVRPKGSEYDCAPVPPKFSPPIGPRLMMDFFTNPEDIGPSSTLVLRQLPKWTSGSLHHSVGKLKKCGEYITKRTGTGQKYGGFLDLGSFLLVYYLLFFGEFCITIFKVRLG